MPDLLIQKPTLSDRLSIKQSAPILLYFALILFLLEIAVFAGLMVLNRSQEQSLVDLNAEIQSKTDVRPETINQIFLLDSRLNNLKQLLGNHMFSSVMFPFLETNTLPRVRFLNFSYKADTHQIDMTGEAASYAILAQQIGVFEKDANVERVEFGGLALGANNLLNFKLAVVLKPSLLQQIP